MSLVGERPSVFLHPSTHHDVSSGLAACVRYVGSGWDEGTPFASPLFAQPGFVPDPVLIALWIVDAYYLPSTQPLAT